MKNKIKKYLKLVAHNTFLRPPYVRHCSQTIYQTLLGCLRMWQATGDSIWQSRAQKLVGILIRIQRPDGGFDIGYDFNFGKLHRAGESTAPELVGLVALTEYEFCFNDGVAIEPAKRCASWIADRVVDMGNGLTAIPYGPYSTQEVMVYNGVSFAVGALGRYLAFIEQSDELQVIYQSMVEYIYNVMSTDNNLAGKFWYYSDQSRIDLSVQLSTKIDYYHQMQQVEMHALAQQVCPVETQLFIIKEASDHVAALSKREAVIPYTNDKALFNGKVHLWGMASIIPGMLEAAKVLPDQAEEYLKVASKVLNWIIQHGWTGSYFSPVLDPSGRSVELERYMVRSDAWVFNALAAYTKYLGQGDWYCIADQCYKNMEVADFSGLESHASTKLSRGASALIKSVLN